MPESLAARGARRGRRHIADLAAEIRGARRSAGLTLAEVAAAVGISLAELRSAAVADRGRIGRFSPHESSDEAARLESSRFSPDANLDERRAGINRRAARRESG